MSATLCLRAPDEAAMEACGAHLAEALQPGLAIYLEGDLGAGKTTLCRGIMRALGHRGAVKSPTYTLVEPYLLPRFTVYHFDFYRLADPEELEFMGVRDYFGGEALCLVEWPERGAGVLPAADLVITIETDGPGRRLTLRAASRRGMALVEQLREAGTGRRAPGSR